MVTDGEEVCVFLLGNCTEIIENEYSSEVSSYQILGIGDQGMQIYCSGLSNEGSAEILQRSRGITHVDGKERSNDLVCRHTSLPNSVSRA